MSNLRIKNKKLKKELERFKECTVQPQIIYKQNRIIKLGCSNIYNFDEFNNLPSDVVVNNLCHSLVSALRPHVSISTYRNIETGQFIVKGKVNVVDKG